MQATYAVHARWLVPHDHGKGLKVQVYKTRSMEKGGDLLLLTGSMKPFDFRNLCKNLEAGVKAEGGVGIRYTGNFFSQTVGKTYQVESMWREYERQQEG